MFFALQVVGLPLLLFCAVTLIARGFGLLHNAHSDKQQLPAGPLGIKFLGNIFHFHALNSRPLASLHDLSSRYPELVTLWLGTWPVIFINSPKAAYALLQKACNRRTF